VCWAAQKDALVSGLMNGEVVEVLRRLPEEAAKHGGGAAGVGRSLIGSRDPEATPQVGWGWRGLVNAKALAAFEVCRVGGV
jgi:hypothetical protein